MIIASPRDAELIEAMTATRKLGREQIRVLRYWIKTPETVSARVVVSWLMEMETA